jgi:glucoamylase
VLVLGVVALAALALSGGSASDRPVPHGFPGFRPSFLGGGASSGADESVGVAATRSERNWLARAEPLEPTAPAWATRMQARSLLVLRALTDPRSGAAVAGAREDWAYVWPRDAAAVAIAFAESGYRAEAGRIVSFLRSLDLDAAARFYADGEPVPGREAQGDAAGWVAAAERAAARAGGVVPQRGSPSGGATLADRVAWRGRADYQEKEGGEYLGNAIASGVSARHIREAFVSPRGLARRAGDPESGLDTAAAWAVRPVEQPGLFDVARRTLLRLATSSGRFGLLPSEGWDGGEDPWTAPTAWTAWSLAALGERRAALRLMAALGRASTPRGLLPERVDAQTGAPRSTTPLAWSHAFAILTLRELWPGRAAG